MKQLKESHKFMQKEISNFLHDNSHQFLKSAENLDQIHSEFEELRAMLNQYNLCIMGLRNQVDRLTLVNENQQKLKMEQKSKEDEERQKEELKDNCDILMEQIEVLLMVDDSGYFQENGQSTDLCKSYKQANRLFQELNK